LVTDLSLSAFYGQRAHRDLHSFPTRRSSDLPKDGPPATRSDALRVPANRADNCSMQKLAAAARRPATQPAPGSDARSRRPNPARDRKSTRLNSSHVSISYAVFCLKKKKHTQT